MAVAVTVVVVVVDLWTTETCIECSTFVSLLFREIHGSSSWTQGLRGTGCQRTVTDVDAAAMAVMYLVEAVISRHAHAEET